MSGRVKLIRTTAFRLMDEDFGSVYVYRSGEDFSRTMRLLEVRARRATDAFKRLPYGGLATALRVITGDFVAVERRSQEGEAFIVSRRPISEAELGAAIGSWEARVLGDSRLLLTQAVSDLKQEKVEVADLIQRRAGLCPTFAEGWAWQAGLWEASHRLAMKSMQTDSGQIQWRVDSDAQLLSWDRLLLVDGKDEAAMHKLRLHLITVPGVEDPVLSVQASLVRLAPAWRFSGGTREVWVDVNWGAPILRAGVKHRPSGDGRWVASWDDGAVEILQGISLDPLPPVDADPVPSGPIRAGFRKQLGKSPFGRGVGPWFHECVAHHMREVLGCEERALTLSPATTPSKYAKAAGRLPLGLDGPASKVTLRLAVIYANSEQRRRIRDALIKVLCDKPHEKDQDALPVLCSQLRNLDDGIDLAVGTIAIRFVRPKDAERYLLQRNEQGQIEEWANSWLLSLEAAGVRVAALIETEWSAQDDPKKKDGLADPKLVLRRVLASRGAATQFITGESAPRTQSKDSIRLKPGEKFREHAAAHAAIDLLRSAGVFLRPFPEFGCGEGTLVVGIHAVRLSGNTTGRKASYVVNLVAVSLGSTEAWGFVDGRGWVPLGEATAHFLSSNQSSSSEQEAKSLVERAVGQLFARFGEQGVVLLFDAIGCRRFWSCLTDKDPGAPEGWMTNNGRAVVRVRADTSELFRPAGVGNWSDKLSPAKHTPFRLMDLNGAEGDSASYVISGSAVMSREISSRRSTRFSAESAALNKDWHALGVTELKVLDPGPFDREQLLQQVGLLCRLSPTWDRTMRWPSPLHLARAVVRDHPHGYSVDGEQMRAEG